MLKAAPSNKSAMHTPRTDQSFWTFWLAILGVSILCSVGLLHCHGNLIWKKENRQETVSPSRDEHIFYSVLDMRLDETVYDIDGVSLGGNKRPKRKSISKQDASNDDFPKKKIVPLVNNPEVKHWKGVQKVKSRTRSETPDVQRMNLVVEAKAISSIVQRSPADSGGDLLVHRLTGKSSNKQLPMKEAELGNENMLPGSDELNLKVGPPSVKSLESSIRRNDNKDVRPVAASGAAGRGELMYIDSDDGMVDTEDGDADEYEDLPGGSGDDGHTHDTEPLDDTRDDIVECGVFLCWSKSQFCDHVTRTCVHCSEICGDSKAQGQRASRPGLISSQYMCAYHCPGFKHHLSVANAMEKLRLFKLR